MSEWFNTTLGDVVEVRVSNVDKKTLLGERSVRLCNYMDVYSTNAVTPERVLMPASATEPEYLRFRLLAGDVIITKDSESPDDIAVPTYIAPGIGEDVVCGYHLAMLRPKPSVDGHFLSYLLRLPEVNLHFANVATGSTRYGLGLQSIHDAPLRIPQNLTEQRGIASVLSALDEQIDATKQEIQKNGRILDGLVDCLLLGEGRTKQLAYFAEVGPKTKGVAPTQSVPFVPMDAITEDGHLPVWQVRQWAQVMSGFTRFTSNDILVAKITPCFENGKGAHVPAGFDVWAGSTEFHVLRAKDGTSSRWLYWHTRSREFRESGAGRMTGSAGQQRVPRSFIEEFPVRDLSKSEQCEAAASLDALDAVIQEDGRELAKLRLQKQGLMRDLLTGKVRVTGGVDA